MKATVKLPKSIKRTLATFTDKQARSHFLKLSIAVLEQETHQRLHRPKADNKNKQD